MSRFNKVITAYRDYLTAGSEYAKALREAVTQLKGKPCPELLGELAAVHAEKYQCKLAWSNKGEAQFYTGAKYTYEGRHNAARMSWQRNVRVHFTIDAPKASPKASFKTEPADPVAKMIKAMEKLTPAQRRKVLAAFA